MEKAQKILVRAPNFLGDHVMARPFYTQLRALFPQAQITLIGPPFVEEFVGDTLNFSFRPLLNEQGQRLPTSRLAASLKAEKYDFSISLVASFSAAYLFWRSAIAHRLGFAETIAMPFLTHAIRWKGRNAGLHKSALYLSLLAEWGTTPHLEFPKTRTATSPPRFVIAPGASLPLREWPYFIELILWLRSRYPSIPVAVVGGKAEAVWHKRLERLADPHILDLVEKTSLPDLHAVFESASLVITNDSGPAHVAASVALARTLVIFGPGDPDYVAPLASALLRVRRTDLPCSPCESAVCRVGEKKACLNGLSVDAVTDVIEKMAIFY